MHRNVNYTCRGNVNNEFQKSKSENKKMIMKRLRFHPEGQSMHRIMLVRGKNTKKHCNVCILLFLYTAKHLFVSSANTFTQLFNRLHRRGLRGHTYRYKFPVPFGGRLVSERPERVGVGGRGDTKRQRGRAADKSRVM